MFGRKKKLQKPDVEFVSAPMLREALAREAAGRMSVGWVISEPMTVLPPGVSLRPPDRAFYFSRVTRPADAALDWMASCVIVATDVTAAHDQLAAALRQRGSAARPEEFVCSQIPEDADGRDYGIVATTMVRQR